MRLKLVKLESRYKQQLFDMLDEWHSAGEKIVPVAIRRTDYHDFEKYCNSLEANDDRHGLVPDSTFFCLDAERNIFVGAVNIRHCLNERLLLNGGAYWRWCSTFRKKKRNCYANDSSCIAGM